MLPSSSGHSAVTLDPADCAGLVAWELAGIDPNLVRKILRENRVRNGRTESTPGTSTSPKKLRGFCSLPMRHPSLPLPMLTASRKRLRPPLAHNNATKSNRSLVADVARPDFADRFERGKLSFTGDVLQVISAFGRQQKFAKLLKPLAVGA